tara:strand:- start:55 stop:417 length:363 start_codon:yes stop_codon:yes gene_type:complete
MIRFLSSRVSSRTVGQAPMRLRRLLPTFMLVLVMGGLVFQALQGERGLRGWHQLRVKNEERAVVLAGLEAENAETMARALRLSAGSLDLDFLDERARIVLGLNLADERVFFNDASPALSD